MVEFKPEHHHEWAEACRFGHTATVKQYLDHGYDPDDRSAWGGSSTHSGIISAAHGGHKEIVEMLIKSLRERLEKKDPEALVYKLTQTRVVQNFAHRATARFIDALSGGDETRAMEECALIADRAAHEVIDTLPVERRRVFQAMFPPLWRRDRTG